MHAPTALRKFVILSVAKNLTPHRVGLQKTDFARAGTETRPYELWFTIGSVRNPTLLGRALHAPTWFAQIFAGRMKASAPTIGMHTAKITKNTGTDDTSVPVSVWL